MSAITLRIDGAIVEVPTGANVAAAIAIADRSFRRSVGGERRAAFCGMGVCFECRVTIGGIPHRLACMTPAREGMEIATGG